jgi:hypothetical protein
MNVSKKARPVFKYLNLSTILARRKNIDLSPIMAICWKRIQYKFFDLLKNRRNRIHCENKVGELQLTIPETKVSFFNPSTTTKNLFPSNLLWTLKYLLANFTTDAFQYLYALLLC